MRKPDASLNNLIDAANAEEGRGTTLSYVQSYRSGGKLVFIKGIIYAGIAKFAVDQCKLTIGTTVVDRYSGRIDKSVIKDTQNIYNYSGVLALTKDLAYSLQLVEAQPSPLENGTHPVCQEKPGCAIRWIELRVKKSKAIHLASTTNDVTGYDGFVTDFDGMTNRFLIPVSSLQAGQNLIALLNGFSASCGTTP